MIDKIKYVIGLYGEFIGIGLITLVVIYDPLIIGLRGFLEWRIGTVGYIATLIGTLLITLSKHWQRHI